MFAPSFFRRGDFKVLKPSKRLQSPSSMAVPAKSCMYLPFRNGRRAPLAEFESLAVENSPAVENHPLISENWNNSPRARRLTNCRHSAHMDVFSELIAEENDGNGNIYSAVHAAPVSSCGQCLTSPTLPRHEPDRGLIDDEILYVHSLTLLKNII
ncbi:hypothetical protein DICVIV_01120 [Dictyocaulus viviparus]|uniref:Uncharacterized protein n=1 Tax=Dictyocaulus viviparus TaxID=29172 RepID=A0A0D8Y9I7_DICVI|nr:hypothetical protein DICVIV_01120 [Dictyocaulus viviparus]